MKNIRLLYTKINQIPATIHSKYQSMKLRIIRFVFVLMLVGAYFYHVAHHFSLQQT